MSMAKSRWYGRNNRPPFSAGDLVTPKTNSYNNKQHRWPPGHVKKVEEVEYDEVSNHWTLNVFNEVVGRISRYTPVNFEHAQASDILMTQRSLSLDIEAYNLADVAATLGLNSKDLQPMTYFQRTQYFGVKLNLGGWGGEPSAVVVDAPKLTTAQLNAGMSENGGFHLADVNGDHEEDENHYDTTPLRTAKTQVMDDIKKIIKSGERWIVCQTVCMMEGEEPRPPIRMTEFR